MSTLWLAFFSIILLGRPRPTFFPTFILLRQRMGQQWLGFPSHFNANKLWAPEVTHLIATAQIQYPAPAPEPNGRS